jgi:hypothetical protein
MEVNPKVSGFRSSITKNFSEKRAITKDKLLRNPHCLSLIQHRNKILARGFANLFQISMIGLEMIAQSNERYILGIAVKEGTVNFAVDTINFMDFQNLLHNGDLTSIVVKLAFGWNHFQNFINKWRQFWFEFNFAVFTTFKSHSCFT